MLFAGTPPASDVSKEAALQAGSTMRFVSPISGGADQSVRHGMADVKENGGENGGERGTFN
jgi:hypothetical protein